jgi:hypothetical protein
MTALPEGTEIAYKLRLWKGISTSKCIFVDAQRTPIPWFRSLRRRTRRRSILWIDTVIAFVLAPKAQQTFDLLLAVYHPRVLPPGPM